MPCPHCADEHLDSIICDDCGAVLKDDERHYYAGRCETCERAWHDRISYWRAGGCDPTLDAMFRGGKQIHH